MTELDPAHVVRLLRAKAADLEVRALHDIASTHPTEAGWLAADMALIAGLLADHIERVEQTLAEVAVALGPNDDDEAIITAMREQFGLGPSRDDDTL